MNFLKYLSAIVILLNVNVAMAALQVGAPAPAFELTDTKGATHKLSDFAGKTVVLEWFNKECPFVRKFYDAGKMQALQKSATDDGVVWLQIGSSAEGKQGYVTAEEGEKARANDKVNSTAYLLDHNGEVGKLYGAKTTPHMYIINTEGNLVYMGAIDSIKSAKSSDVENADNYVELALASIKSGEPIKTTVTSPYGCSVKY